MLTNLHDLSEPSRHRDICASSSRQEATASPSPTQLTEHLTASCGNPASLGDVISSVLPQFIVVIIFPVQFKQFCSLSVIFFNALHFRASFLLFHFPHLTSPTPACLRSFLSFPEGFSPHLPFLNKEPLYLPEH